MATDRENLLISVLEKGIEEAWDYHPVSYREHDPQEIFINCKGAMTELARMGSERGIDKIAYICRECIRDGFGSSTGIGDHASKTLAQCEHPLALFHQSLLQEDLLKLLRAVGQSPSFRTRLFQLSSQDDDLDPYESPTNLLHQSAFAKKALRILDNKEELKKVLQSGIMSARENASEEEINKALAQVYSIIEELPEIDKMTVLKNVCKNDEGQAVFEICIGLLRDYAPELVSRVEYNLCQLFKDNQRTLLSVRLQIIKRIYNYSTPIIFNPQIKEIVTSGLRGMGEPAIDELISDIRKSSKWGGADIFLKTIGKPSVPKILEELKNTRNMYVKWRITLLLGDIGDISAVEPLIEALSEKDKDVRRQAVESLRMITKHHFLLGNGSQTRWQNWWDKNKSRLQSEKQQ